MLEPTFLVNLLNLVNWINLYIYVTLKVVRATREAHSHINLLLILSLWFFIQFDLVEKLLVRTWTSQ